MIKVHVTNGNISIQGHANYNDYGKDIVCAAVSSIVMCSVEAMALFDKDSVNVIENNNKIDLVINYNTDITDKLICNMINCLKEIEKKYPKNIKIINKEE